MKIARLFYLIPLLFLCNCDSLYYVKADTEPFKDLYAIVPDSTDYKRNDDVDESVLSFSCNQMSFPSFVRWFSDNSNYAVVYDIRADSLTVSGEWKDAKASDILKSVSRRLGLELVREGDTYFIGQLKPEDRGILVKYMKGYSQDELKQAITVLMSEFGRSSVYKNGLCVVSDKESVLTKVSELFSQIESIKEHSWIVQLYFIGIRRDSLYNMGVDVKPSGELAYKIAGANGGGAQDLNYESEIKNVFKASMSNTFADMRGCPMFIMRDGSKGKWLDGQKLPIPTKTVSEYGVVTTTGYQYLEVGTSVNISIRQASGGSVMTIDISDSRVTGYTDLAPEIATVNLSSEMLLESNKIYLIGEMNILETINGVKAFGLFDKDNSGHILQVWARVYEIYPPIRRDYKTYADSFIDKSNYVESIEK